MISTRRRCLIDSTPMFTICRKCSGQMFYTYTRIRLSQRPTTRLPTAQRRPHGWRLATVVGSLRRVVGGFLAAASGRKVRR